MRFPSSHSATSDVNNSTLNPATFPRASDSEAFSSRCAQTSFPLTTTDIELHEIAYSAKEAAARRLTHTLLPHFVPPSDRDRDHPLTQPHLPEAWPESLTA